MLGILLQGHRHFKSSGTIRPLRSRVATDFNPAVHVICNFFFFFFYKTRQNDGKSGDAFGLAKPDAYAASVNDVQAT